VPEATTEHVAEVMLSGLVRELDDASDGERDPDAVLYDLVEGAREALLTGVPLARAAEVMRAGSAHVQREAGSAVDVAAVLRGEELGLRGDAPMGRVFARVAPTVLRALGLAGREAREEHAAAPKGRPLTVMVAYTRDLMFEGSSKLLALAN